VPAVFFLSLAATATAPPERALGAPPAPLVHLPADQAAHPGAANEWWYVVGHLTSGRRTFGYEVTVFKFHRVRLPGLAVPVSIFRTDVAITNENAGHFYHRVTYAFPGSVNMSTSSLSVNVGSASLVGSSPSSMRLHASLPSGLIDLHLASKRPAMDVGGRGYIAFGNGYSYYYSLTDVATAGTLHVHGVTYHVQGISWLDHQWGKWSWTSIRGWTWMALQLANGVQLSVFDFRGTTTRVKAASVLLAGGMLRTVYGVSIAPIGSWTSPHTHAAYPSGWTVRVPALGATLHVRPTVKDQEVYATGGGLGTYWEGSGRISGLWSGKSVAGLSYTELTGYTGGFR
jgi:predicted secreted hydrolase